MLGTGENWLCGEAVAFLCSESFGCDIKPGGLFALLSHIPHLHPLMFDWFFKIIFIAWLSTTVST